MDIVGLVLGAAACLVCAHQAWRSGSTARTVRRLKRSGTAVTGRVVGTDTYRMFDVRTIQRRPVVQYRAHDRSYETVVENYAGTLPDETGIALLVDPDSPYTVVAADRNDARNETVLMAVISVLALGVAVWSAVGY